jgi:hypothetical protein
LLGAGDGGGWSRRLRLSVSTPNTSFDRPPDEASIVDAELREGREMVSLSQVNKRLGLREKSPSSCDGILRSIDQTTSMANPAVNQSVTRVFDQMQMTVTSLEVDCEHDNTSLSSFPHSGSLCTATEPTEAIETKFDGEEEDAGRIDDPKKVPN